MGRDGQVEDGDNGASPFDDVAGDQWTQRNTREENAVEVAKRDVSSCWRGTVRDISIGKSHGGDERTAKTVKDKAEKEPIDGEGFGHSCGKDGNDLCDQHSGGDQCDHARSPVAVRNRAQLRARNGREKTSDNVAVEGKLGDPRLYGRYPALRVIGAEQDRNEMVTGVFQLLFVEVFAADEGDNQIDFGDDDTAKSQCGQQEWR